MRRRETEWQRYRRKSESHNAVLGCLAAALIPAAVIAFIYAFMEIFSK